MLRRYKAYVERYPDDAAVTNVDMNYPLSIIRDRDKAVAMGRAIAIQQTAVTDVGMSSDYVENHIAAAGGVVVVPRPPVHRRHERLTGRSIQERRAAPMPVGMMVEENVHSLTAAAGNTLRHHHHQVTNSSTTGSGSNLLARMGLTRKN